MVQVEPAEWANLFAGTSAATRAEGSRLNRAMWVQLDQRFEAKRGALANVMPEEARQREAFVRASNDL